MAKSKGGGSANTGQGQFNNYQQYWQPPTNTPNYGNSSKGGGFSGGFGGGYGGGIPDFGGGNIGGGNYGGNFGGGGKRTGFNNQMVQPRMPSLEQQYAGLNQGVQAFQPLGIRGYTPPPQFGFGGGYGGSFNPFAYNSFQGNPYEMQPQIPSIPTPQPPVTIPTGPDYPGGSPYDFERDFGFGNFYEDFEREYGLKDFEPAPPPLPTYTTQVVEGGADIKVPTPPVATPESVRPDFNQDLNIPDFSNYNLPTTPVQAPVQAPVQGPVAAPQIEQIEQLQQRAAPQIEQRIQEPIAPPIAPPISAPVAVPQIEQLQQRLQAPQIESDSLTVDQNLQQKAIDTRQALELAQSEGTATQGEFQAAKNAATSANLQKAFAESGGKTFAQEQAEQSRADQIAKSIAARPAPAPAPVSLAPPPAINSRFLRRPIRGGMLTGGLVKGYAEGGQIESNESSDRLEEETVMALMGKHPNPKDVFTRYLEAYGEDGLMALAAEVEQMMASQGRMIEGQGNGTSDEIPAMIDGMQPAALSKDEYVIPADVVAHSGNGSSEAGGKKFDQLVSRVRKDKTGNTEQPEGIEFEQIRDEVIRQ